MHHADLHGANLHRASLNGADLGWANLSEADLSKATLIDTNLTGAVLTQCAIYGPSVWDVQLEGARQDNLIITQDDEPVITVDDLEIAQFIYLLLNHQKFRHVFNAVTQRGVLLLGRFGGGGLEVLQTIAARLREAKYLPIIFDFERPHDHDYTETVKTLAGLARFIIVDLSGPSVPQELSHTIPFLDIPFVPIL
ncbi:MAG TPA: pentapeptide repeat-containing protein, partial [Ktedonobacteraceae bacterium]|nr:pentapeptide repeat-containing protein [Ktedonobacteraceae bacterium]